VDKKTNLRKPEIIESPCIDVRYSKSRNFHRFIQFRVVDLSKESAIREAVQSRMPHQLQDGKPSCSVSTAGIFTAHCESCSLDKSATWARDIMKWVGAEPVLQRIGVLPTDVYFSEVRPNTVTE